MNAMAALSLSNLFHRILLVRYHSYISLTRLHVRVYPTAHLDVEGKLTSDFKEAVIVSLLGRIHESPANLPEYSSHS